MTVSVIIADDEGVTRQGLIDFLESDPEIEIKGIAVDGIDAVKKAQELHPDVIIMDLRMPLMDGIEATLQLKKTLPKLKVIIVSGIVEINQITKALNAGAKGYLLKTTSPLELCQAVKQIGTQVIMLSSAVAQVLVDNIANKPTLEATILSNREREVVALIVEGKSNKEISYQLNLSEGTIKTQVSILLAKLNVQSRTQLALYANSISRN